MKITAVALKLGQTSSFISPTSPKTQKREKRGKGSESEGKKTIGTVFSFYSVDFRVFERQKNQC